MVFPIDHLLSRTAVPNAVIALLPSTFFVIGGKGFTFDHPVTFMITDTYMSFCIDIVAKSVSFILTLRFFSA